MLWPEDVVDVPGVLAGSPEEQALAALAADLRTTIVAGVVEDLDDDRFRNAVVVFGPDGRMIDRYDKVHLVPFGEYIPARPLLRPPGRRVRRPPRRHRRHGDRRVDTPAGRLGVLISYEVFFADRGRAAVRAGGRLLLVPTNASSFDDAQVPAHELAVARLRAVETGRWVVQAAPTGYSAVIDHRGRVLSAAAWAAAAVLRHDVQLRTGRTALRHPRTGPRAFSLAVALLLLWIRRRKSERGNDRFADGSSRNGTTGSDRTRRQTVLMRFDPFRDLDRPSAGGRATSAGSDRCPDPARTAPPITERIRVRSRPRLGRGERVERRRLGAMPSLVEHLVGDPVAEPGRERLVEQHRLDRLNPSHIICFGVRDLPGDLSNVDRQGHAESGVPSASVLSSGVGRAAESGRSRSASDPSAWSGRNRMRPGAATASKASTVPRTARCSWTECRSTGITCSTPGSPA